VTTRPTGWAKKAPASVRPGSRSVGRAPPEDYDEWLDPAVEDKAILEVMPRPYPAGQMEATPVSNYVNNARHGGPQCLAPAG
jgi:putative SOS response-associated peptidase YedK